MSRTRLQIPAFPGSFWVTLVFVIALGFSSVAAQPPPVTQVAAPTLQQAEEEAKEEPFWRVGVTVFGGANSYKMDDLNNSTSAFFSGVVEPVVPNVGTEPIETGAAYGAGIRLYLMNRFLVEIDYEKLRGSTEFGGELLSWEVSVPATVIMYTVGVDIMSTPGVRFGVGGGLGQYSSKVKQRFEADEMESFDVTVDGDALGSHFVLFFEYQLTDRLFVNAMGGYRRADIKGPVVDEDAIPYDEWELPEAIDWSGFMGRAGFAVYF